MLHFLYFLLKKFHKIHFISRSPSPISSQIIPTFLPLQLHALFFFLFIKQKCEMTHCHYGRQDNTDVYHCPKHLCILIYPSLHPSSLAITDIFFFCGRSFLLPGISCYYSSTSFCDVVGFDLFICLLALFGHGLTMLRGLTLNSGYFRTGHVCATLSNFLNLVLPPFPLCSQTDLHPKPLSPPSTWFQQIKTTVFP